jgi:hypothetical protein
MVVYDFGFVHPDRRRAVGQFEMTGARTVPVRSGGAFEHSPVAFVVERAADGDRPRSGQTDPLPGGGMPETAYLCGLKK